MYSNRHQNNTDSKRLALIEALAAIAFVLALCTFSADAATFVVNTTADTQDVSVQDGICADASGACSLRAAISQANFSAGADVITLPAGTYTISLVAANEDLNNGGDFDITSAVTINGAGASSTFVQAAATANSASERVFHITSTLMAPNWYDGILQFFGNGQALVAINGITIRNGNYNDNTFGGGVRMDASGLDLTLNDDTISNNRAASGGAVFFAAPGSTLTISNAIIQANTAASSSTGTPASGGGLWNNSAGNLVLTNSTITGNTASSTQSNAIGGGINAGGGGATLTITGSTISSNSASSTQNSSVGAGGGIANLGAQVTISNSTITNNSAAIYGGITNSPGTLIITNSTISNNTATGGGFFAAQGGGIFNGGTTTITDSTIRNNSATGQSGFAGGIYNQGGGGPPAVIDITNSTITGNTAHDAAGLYNAAATTYLTHASVVSNTAVGNGGNLYVDNNGAVIIKNCIVATGSSAVGPDLFTFGNGQFTSQGSNLIGTTSGSNIVPAPSDIVGQNPLLTTLANNGGPTLTFLPGAGSPVIDAIPKGSNDCGTTITTDQRGFVRPSGIGCDIGSVEVQVGGTPTPTPTPTPTATPTPTPVPCIPPEPAHIIVGTDLGSNLVDRYEVPSLRLTAGFFAFDSGFTGGVRVAAGDVNGDGVADIITGAGPGGGPHVRAFDGSCEGNISDFFAYDPAFTGGIYVAAGDINGDGKADIVTGTGDGTQTVVRVFDGATSEMLQNFIPFNSFTGGVRVAAGDVNGDGFDDIVAGAGAGGGPLVKVFDGHTNKSLHSFFAYDPAFTGGVYVATGDVNGDGFADIITGAGAGGGPHVKVFNGVTLNVLRDFFAFDPAFTGGVRVAVGDVDSDQFADIVTGAEAETQAGGPHVKVFSGLDNSVIQDFFAFDPSFTGGVFVAAPKVITCVPHPNIVADGGFEATTDQGTNPNWASTSTAFGTSLCNLDGCGDGGGTAAPRTGNGWTWFDGTGDGSTAENASVSQTIVIPTGDTATLNYYLRVGSVTAPSASVFTVRIDGMVVQTINEPASAESTYSLRTVDLSSFADGSAKTLSFNYSRPGGASGSDNFTIDDITLSTLCPGVTPTPTPTSTPTPTPTPPVCETVISYDGPAIEIPDNDADGVDIPIVVSGLSAISDLNFQIDGTASSSDPASTTVGVNHSWLGDLVFKLTSPVGTTVTLIDRVGFPASSFGCPSNNMFNVKLDDDGTFPMIDDGCPGDDDAGPLTGRFLPENALSAFDNQVANGTWILNVSDVAGGDTGMVRSFSLAFACPGATVSGRVLTPNGQGLRNAVVSMIDSNDHKRTATTNSFGSYRFDNVETGRTYVMAVSAKRYRFQTRMITVTDDLSDIDFVGLE